MPEIKNTFTQGKMNKDLDERLVQNGQYRDAMNVQVSTSEGSDVGVVQNILGNVNLFSENQIAPGSVCVGAIADEKTDCFYWFVYHPTKSLILQYKRNEITFVFVDTHSVLKFNGDLITGVNIIDDFLLWTDNTSEPKKINIKRSIDGTRQNGSHHTNLVVPKRNITIENCIKVREEHITVIKKYPKSKLHLDPTYVERNKATTVFDFDPDGNDQLMEVGEEGIMYFDNFNPNNAFWNIGDIILLNPQSSINKLPESYQVRIKITEQILLSSGSYKFTIMSISDITSKSLITYDCEKEVENLIFTRKFVRFGYRYKYNDGEYSSFSPFTEVLFNPGEFEYNATEAYNKAMENNLVSLKLRNFLTKETPEDVVQVDILYKESNSPVVYIIDKIKYNDIDSTLVSGEQVNFWHANLYEIKSDLIYAAVSENQLLRPWDNVPKKALAQEVTGNRVVYGNYEQNYDMNVKPILNSDIISRYNNNTTYLNNYIDNNTSIPVPFSSSITSSYGQRSLKSLRNYQLGVTYLDEYGRETPVFTSTGAGFEVSKRFADNKVKISGKIETLPPDWAESFKVYIKETSTEYYNLAMSRVYKAKDSGVWLSFPSSERNKVDEETFLILKKAADTNKLIENEAKYKILAIENEAPEYLTFERSQLALFSCGGSKADDVFGIDGPTVNKRTFKVTIAEWANTGAEDLDSISELQVGFKNPVTNEYSSIYNVKSVKKEPSYYVITLDKLFQTHDAQFIYPNYPDTLNAGNLDIGSDINILFYKNEKKVDQSEFKGVFFVKIKADEVIDENILTFDDGIEIVNTLPAHYFSDSGSSTSGWNFQTFVTGNTQSISNNGGGNAICDLSPEWDDLLDFGGDSNDLFPNTDDLTGDTIGGFFIDNTGYKDIKREFGGASSSNVDSARHVMQMVRDFLEEYRIETGIIFFTGPQGQTSSFTSNSSRANYLYNNIFPRFLDKRSLLGTTSINKSLSTNGDEPNFGKGIYSCLAVDADEFGLFNGTQAFPYQFFASYDWDTDPSQIIAQGGIKHFVELSFSGMSENLATGDVINSDDELQYGSTNNYSAFNLNVNPAAQADYAQNYSALDNELQTLASRLTVGSRFKIRGADQDTVFTIKGVGKEGRYNHTSWFQVWATWFMYVYGSGLVNSASTIEEWFDLFGSPTNRRTTYILELDKDLSQITLDGDNILHANNVNINKPLAFQFISKRTTGDGGNEQVVSENPAIWETEPKETVDLDIYHEASEALPVAINEKNNTRFIPLGSVVSCPDKVGVVSNSLTYVVAWDDKKITLSRPINLNNYTNQKLVFTRPNDSYTTLRIDVGATTADTTLNPNTYIIKHEVSRNPFALSWYNSFSFGNGVESNRIRDDFNQPIIDKGAKVSTVLEENYEKERRSSGLIYSGIYNTNSGVNNLNQFIQAEKITKDLNPTYGSIQKLYQRRINLVAFCEDRVVKILSNKDALYNADGDINLTATNRVLGDASPFAGSHGISKNPESFAVDNYRAYFTDKQRGAVLRLSMDGITPISQYGMNDYFKDNLKLNDKLIGSFDIKKGEYNLTMPNIQKTVSFKESVNGWSSFKSFIPKQGISISGDYYTIKDALPYRHHDENVDRNTFYNQYTASSINVLLNESPSTVKMYKTLSYEGSQSNVNKETSRVESGYYNLENKAGWKSKVKTDKQDGVVSEFVEKEGKWFNYIKGINFDEVIDLRTKEFSFQGVGRPTSFEIDFDKHKPIIGCTKPGATNYNPDAVIDDGSCIFDPIDYDPPVGGCMDPNANNYNPDATFDDGSCEIPCETILGCTNPNSLNFNPNATEDDGSCIAIVRGCTDPRASNYDPNANVDDGSCILVDPDPTTAYDLTIQDLNDNDGATQNY